MPILSQDSKKIRTLIESMNDEDLRSSGPKDLEDAIEKMGLVYAVVRERVNNELARARKLRGIRKGRGRRIAAQFPTDEEHLELFKLFSEMDSFRRRFDSWKMAREVAEEVVSFINGFGSAASFLSAVKIKEQDEATERPDLL